MLAPQVPQNVLKFSWAALVQGFCVKAMSVLRSILLLTCISLKICTEMANICALFSKIISV